MSDLTKKYGNLDEVEVDDNGKPSKVKFNKFYHSSFNPNQTNSDFYNGVSAAVLAYEKKFNKKITNKINWVADGSDTSFVAHDQIFMFGKNYVEKDNIKDDFHDKIFRDFLVKQLGNNKDGVISSSGLNISNTTERLSGVFSLLHELGHFVLRTEYKEEYDKFKKLDDQIKELNIKDPHIETLSSKAQEYFADQFAIRMYKNLGLDRVFGVSAEVLAKSIAQMRGYDVDKTGNFLSGTIKQRDEEIKKFDLDKDRNNEIYNSYLYHLNHEMRRNYGVLQSNTYRVFPFVKEDKFVQNLVDSSIKETLINYGKIHVEKENTEEKKELLNDMLKKYNIINKNRDNKAVIILKEIDKNKISEYKKLNSENDLNEKSKIDRKFDI